MIYKGKALKGYVIYIIPYSFVLMKSDSKNKKEIEVIIQNRSKVAG